MVNKKMNEKNKECFNVAIVLHVEAVNTWHKIEQFLNENSKIIFVQRAPDGVRLTVKRDVKNFGNTD
jgi:hypothetical protein